MAAPPTLKQPFLAFDYAPFATLLLNRKGELLHANSAAHTLLEGCLPARGAVFPEALAVLGQLITTGERLIESSCYHKHNDAITIKWVLRWHEEEQLVYCFGEISPHGSIEQLALLEKNMLQLNMQPSVSMHEVADALLRGIEQLFPGTRCSILRLHADGALWHYAAPSLDKAYMRLIDGTHPGPRVGSCGTAVHLDKPVIVSDIQANPLWEDYKHIAAAFGLKACWSIPIHHSKGSILGTFAIYYDYCKAPSAFMLQAIERLSSLIGLLIENSEIVDNLQLSNERYNLAARATHDVIWDWDVQKDEVLRNEEGKLNSYGILISPAAKRINDLVERIHPDDRERVSARIEAIKHRGTESLFEVDYRLLKENGECLFIRNRGYIMRNGQGMPVRLIGAAQDITARVKAEQTLRESEERYRQLFDNNPLPMWLFDLTTHRFLEVNRMAVQHYGYQPEEFARMTIFDIIPRHEKQRLNTILKQNKSGRLPYLDGRWQHTVKNGDLVQVELFSHKITYKGHPAMMVLVNDVTQTLLLQQQLAKEKNTRQKDIMKATVAAQEKEKNELGNELHDNINQILSSAKLYLECIGMYETDTEQYRLSSFNLLNRGIEEIRRLSKSMVPPRLHEMGLIDSVKDILDNMEETRHMDVDFNYDGFDEAAVSEGLNLDIYRIIQEQTTNILKHADASKVSVRICLKLRFVVLQVNDNGIGFDTSQLRKGIGLTNITNRASIYQGRVTIVSSPGNGCSLTVFFDTMA